MSTRQKKLLFFFGGALALLVTAALLGRPDGFVPFMVFYVPIMALALWSGQGGGQ